jgi:hypothetical protein
VPPWCADVLNLDRRWLSDALRNHLFVFRAAGRFLQGRYWADPRRVLLKRNFDPEAGWSASASERWMKVRPIRAVIQASKIIRTIRRPGPKTHVMAASKSLSASIPLVLKIVSIGT